MPERLSERAAALIPMIIVLPMTNMEIDGASFGLTNAVLVFEGEYEQLTVLHEIAHILDPGWEHAALAEAYQPELKKVPQYARRVLTQNGNVPLETFAELASWEMAGVKELRHLPKSAAIVHEALNWEG